LTGAAPGTAAEGYDDFDLLQPASDWRSFPRARTNGAGFFAKIGIEHKDPHVSIPPDDRNLFYDAAAIYEEPIKPQMNGRSL
jgi:hypothetical protein